MIWSTCDKGRNEGGGQAPRVQALKGQKIAFEEA